MDVDGEQEYDEDCTGERIVHVRELVRRLPLQSDFFKQVEELEPLSQAFLLDTLNAILDARANSFVSFEDFKRISKKLLFNITNSHLNPAYSREAVQLAETFRTSEAHQKCYLKRSNMFIESSTVKINNKSVGQYINVIELSQLILKNVSVVQSIVDEQKRVPQKKFAKYDNELCCSIERQNLLAGRLRLELGIDDFSITKQSRKFFAVYGVFTNIPPKERLKRRDIFLIAIAEREVLKNANVSINEFMQQLVSDLKELTENGIPIRVRYESGRERTMTIKATLSALVADNLGE